MSTTPPKNQAAALRSLVWLVPGVVALLLMAFAPQLEQAVCPRELKAAQGCGILFPVWTYWVLAAVAAGSVARTVWAWRKAVRAD